MPRLLLVLGLLLTVTACGSDPEQEPTASLWDTVQQPEDRLFAIEGGLDGPEAVRYDAGQDVYFVSNFTGNPGEADGTGFIARVSAADGQIETLRFMVGTDEYPLHAGRGMYFAGDTLWVADRDGVHGFHRETGEHLAFVDFTEHDPGFLNDLALGPDGALYVTDTGRSRVYRMAAGRATIALADTTMPPPNGITWDADEGRFLLAPWGGRQDFYNWFPDRAPGQDDLGPFTTSAGGRFDGIEAWADHLLVASQSDSTLYALHPDTNRAVIRLPGRPADIGVDTQRGRVAIPYVSLDRVDVFALPPRQ